MSTLLQLGLRVHVSVSTCKIFQVSSFLYDLQVRTYELGNSWESSVLSSAVKSSSTFTAMTRDTNTKAVFQSVATIRKMCMQEHSTSEICQSCERNPTGTQCQNDVVLMSMRSA